jgi:hypothetical protein
MINYIHNVLKKTAGLFSDPSSHGDYRDFLLRNLPKRSAGCEVGVWKGEFSERILKIVQPRKLFLVDPWLFLPEFPGTWYGGTASRNQNDMDEIYQEVLQKVGERKNTVILRKSTSELTDEIQDGELDWVYIDGNHEYKYVLADLVYFNEKVKGGGIICGDDYDRNTEKNYPIARAVQEYLRQSGQKIQWVKDHQFFIRKS